MRKEVLQELALDNDSDMESEEDHFLPDDFVTVVMKPRQKNQWFVCVHACACACVCVCVCEKGLENVCLLNYPPFQHGCSFVTMTIAHSITRCKLLSQSIHKHKILL